MFIETLLIMGFVVIPAFVILAVTASKIWGKMNERWQGYLKAKEEFRFDKW